MPLKLERRKNSGIWRIRGTVQGQRVDRSARTRSRTEARQIAKSVERQILLNTFTDRRPQSRTFTDAALGYLKSGKGGPYDIERVILLMDDKPLADITQGYIDRKAMEGWPDAAPATRLRAFYVPVGAILDYAQGERWMPAFRIKRPRPGKGRTDWRTPAEAEALINAMRGMRDMTIFLFGTGCRISEACRLQWKDVSPDGQRVTFWITKTRSRSFLLCDRTRAALPNRRGREDYVWTNDHGDPWSESPDGKFYGPRRKMERRCAQLDLPHTTPHVCRHSWASWHYAVDRDTLTLMRDGGWGSLDLVQRYTHLGSDDLADQVRAFGWFKFGQYLGNFDQQAYK